MTRTELIAELRDVIDDTVAPYGWSDLRLVSWLAEGQDRFCDQTGFWADKNTYTIITVLNQLDYAIPTRVVSLRSVWDGERELIDGATNQTLIITGEPQRPLRYRTDLQTGMITLLEPPLAGIVLTLRVHRRSKSPLRRKSSSITLAGAFHTGDVVTATVNGTTFSYTTLAGDATLSAVATALAALIDASEAFTASASGQVITIASSDLSVSTTTTVSVSGAGATTTATALDYYSAELEIPEEFHLAPVEYAAHKAFGDHDRELQDPVKAGDHLKTFKAYVKDGKAAYRRLSGSYSDSIPDSSYIV